MALGGGNFTVQNKVAPGAYINFVSASRASAELSDRGVAAMAVELGWGVEKEIFRVEASDFEKEALRVFGYPYYAQQLRGIRDLLKHAKTAYLYRLNAGEKAENDYGTAKYGGIRGNSLKTVIRVNVDDSSKFDVITFLENIQVDIQTVADASELQENGFVVPKAGASLAETAGAVFTGGTDGETVTGKDYALFLDKLESYSFHTLGCLSTDALVKGLFVSFTKRMRDEMGVKFQTVVHDADADYEGVINVKNTVADAGERASALVSWVTGASAGCPVNRTLTNVLYDGEFTPDTELKQSELEDLLKAGGFVFHKAGTQIRVLEDVNSLISYSDEKGEDFSENQVVRVLDLIGNDIAVTFNTRYLGKVQNNEAGRTGLWNDIVSYDRKLEAMGAIESFSSGDVTVKRGGDKKSVVVSCCVTPVCSMSKLYMTCVVA